MEMQEEAKMGLMTMASTGQLKGLENGINGETPAAFVKLPRKLRLWEWMENTQKAQEKMMETWAQVLKQPK